MIDSGIRDLVCQIPTTKIVNIGKSFSNMQKQYFMSPDSVTIAEFCPSFYEEPLYHFHICPRVISCKCLFLFPEMHIVSINIIWEVK